MGEYHHKDKQEEFWGWTREHCLTEKVAKRYEAAKWNSKGAKGPEETNDNDMKDFFFI